MSTECTAEMNQAEISVNQFVHRLRHRQSLVSLSLIDCCIFPTAKSNPSPVSMKDLKEIILQKVVAGLCPATFDVPQSAGSRSSELYRSRRLFGPMIGL
jgi:hypothetical protein